MKQKGFDNAMRRQVWSLPELTGRLLEDLKPKTHQLLTTPEIFSLRKIVMTGCGDSFAAALAAKAAFERLTGLPAEAVSAIDAARFYPSGQIGQAPNTPLLIAVSHSGAVARVTEAVLRFNCHGAFTVAVTGNPDSPLVKEASRVLHADIPPFESAPGVRTYLASVLALLLTAVRIGEVRGIVTMDEANGYRNELEAQASRLRELLETMDDEIFRVAQEWKVCEAFEFVGAGPDYAAAWYGHAKIFEAAGKYAMHVNTEEWLHLNFFVRSVEKTAAVLVVDKHSPSMSRAKEVAEHIARVGRPLMIVTNADRGLFPSSAHVIPVPDGAHGWLAPVTQFVPLALLAGYLAAMLGEEYGRGARDNWAACRDGATTKNSEIVII